MTIEDRNTGIRFRIDSAADVSVYPVSHDMSNSTPKTQSLIAANGTQITTWGRKNIKLHFGVGNGRAFTQEFYVANVTEPILGADFFINNKLVIDLANSCLLDIHDATSIKIIPCTRSNDTISGLHLQLISEFGQIVQEFPEVLVSNFTGINKHGIEHHIVTSGAPVHAKARRLSKDKLAAAKAEFLKMESMGIVRRSKSSWSSPLHLVTKPHRSYRVCGDYRRLNVHTEDDRYPLPNIQDFNNHLAGCSIFSKIDLIRGYNQVPVLEEHIPKTAVITPFGLWEFLRMPFGQKNAAQTFQRLMDGVLRDIEYVFVYLDDILIGSKNPAEHKVHLRKVFELLVKNGLLINKPKCVFGVPELDYLGHRVTSEGITPLKSRVEAIKSFPIPNSKKSLQRFLGMLNFYRRFIPNLVRFCIL